MEVGASAARNNFAVVGMCIENKKQNLIRQQSAALMTMQSTMQQSSTDSATDNNNGEATWRLQQSTNETLIVWKNLIDEFQLSTPPASCQDLHTKYLDHLVKVQRELSNIQQSFASMQSDPARALQSLEATQKAGSSEVVEVARQADAALNALCNRYQIHKTIDIKVNP